MIESLLQRQRAIVGDRDRVIEALSPDLREILGRLDPTSMLHRSNFPIILSSSSAVSSDCDCRVSARKVEMQGMPPGKGTLVRFRPASKNVATGKVAGRRHTPGELVHIGPGGWHCRLVHDGAKATSLAPNSGSSHAALIGEVVTCRSLTEGIREFALGRGDWNVQVRVCSPCEYVQLGSVAPTGVYVGLHQDVTDHVSALLGLKSNAGLPPMLPTCVTSFCRNQKPMAASPLFDSLSVPRYT